MTKKTQNTVFPVERIVQSISMIRGEKVMLDSDLSALYGVETRALNQAVTRNTERFPDDFMFQLTPEEHESLRSQIVTLKSGRGQHRKYCPRAFTESGVAMLSTVLKSQQAIQVNIAIMRTFVRMREVLATHKDLARKVAKHDKEIATLYDYLQKLLELPQSSKRQIGYIQKEKK